MKSAASAILLMASLCAALPVSGQDLTQKLATCLVDSLNGRERKQLAKWIFFAMATHPELAPKALVSDTDKSEIDRYVGTLISRLLTEDCSAQLTAAYQASPTAIENAFHLVGQVAMQEIMANKGVEKALTNYMQFADLKQINKILTDK